MTIKYEREQADLKYIYTAFFAARLCSLALAPLERPPASKLDRFETAWGIMDALMARYPVTLSEETINAITERATLLFHSIMSERFVIQDIGT